MSEVAYRRAVVGITGLAGVGHVALGAWAFLAPRSFYTQVATFPPYHEHFLHDVGAFLVGLGVALLAALVWRDALFVALAGGTTAALLHWLSHVRDHDHGGRVSDPWTLGAFALLLVIALGLRFRSRTGQGEGSR